MTTALPFFFVLTNIIIYIYACSRRFYPKRLTVLYIFVSMCVPWELNPQPFALKTQCSTTEPQEQSMESRSTNEDFGSKKEQKKKKGPYFLVQFETICISLLD